jgi:hypothetical protein
MIAYPSFTQTWELLSKCISSLRLKKTVQLGKSKTRFWDKLSEPRINFEMTRIPYEIPPEESDKYGYHSRPDAGVQKKDWYFQSTPCRFYLTSTRCG